jgi:hypothetical protein
MAVGGAAQSDGNDHPILYASNPSNRRIIMANEESQKTPAEIARGIISQLKEMEHYSRSNAEKLSAIWMTLSDDLKQGDFAERVNELLNKQGDFQEAIEPLITDYEKRCAQEEAK